MTVEEYSPAVSILMPARNHPKLVWQAIDSTLSQTYQRIEVYVVDDGSVLLFGL